MIADTTAYLQHHSAQGLAMSYREPLTLQDLLRMPQIAAFLQALWSCSILSLNHIGVFLNPAFAGVGPEACRVLVRSALRTLEDAGYIIPRKVRTIWPPVLSNVPLELNTWKPPDFGRTVCRMPYPPDSQCREIRIYFGGPSLTNPFPETLEDFREDTTHLNPTSEQYTRLLAEVDVEIKAQCEKEHLPATIPGDTVCSVINQSAVARLLHSSEIYVRLLSRIAREGSYRQYPSNSPLLRADECSRRMLLNAAYLPQEGMSNVHNVTNYAEIFALGLDGDALSRLFNEAFNGCRRGYRKCVGMFGVMGHCRLW